MKIYKNVEGSNFIKVELSYQKGGMNYMTGTTERRGIYATFRNVERVQNNGYITESFSMLGGKKEGKILLEELGRASQKKLDLYNSILQEKEKEIFEVYENRFGVDTVKELFK